MLACLSLKLEPGDDVLNETMVAVIRGLHHLDQGVDEDGHHWMAISGFVDRQKLDAIVRILEPDPGPA